MNNLAAKGEERRLTHGSLFAGIGGFDLGFERVGFETVWQVEINDYCRRVLERHFPRARRYRDIRDCCGSLPRSTDGRWVNVLTGGDPCPAHSRARSNGTSKHPDLSGFFLSMAARLKPRWVVRENVPAPTVDEFSGAMECLGYGTVVVRVESSPLTGQLRQRDYIIGCRETSGESLRTMFSDCANGKGAYTTRLGTREIIPALTTHRTRYDSRDCYVWEPGTPGLRILDAEEREAAAGFPGGWTAGFSEATRARMCGNAVVPQIAQWIGERIKAVATDQASERKS